MGKAATCRYWVFGRNDRGLETTDLPVATPIPRLGERLCLAESFGLNVPVPSLTSYGKSGASPYHCGETLRPPFKAGRPEFDRLDRSFVQAVVNIFATLGNFPYTFRRKER